jgi:hypothetical protein
MPKSLISPSLEEELSDQEMEEMMAKLIEGQHFVVNLGNIPDEAPPWLDMKKYEAGKQFVNKYYG